MPTEERKKSRRARTTAMLERVDQELAESERERRDPRRGVVLSAIRWEIAARAEAVEALEDVTADLLAEIQQISSRQAGALSTVGGVVATLRDVHEHVIFLRKSLSDIQAKLSALSGEVSKNSAKIEMTRGDLALARAKWLGWRGLIFSVGITIHELIKHLLGGTQ